MARLPRQLKVGSFFYTLHTSQEAYDREAAAQERGFEAYTNVHSTEMVFRPGRGADWTADSALHEALHAAFNFNGVDLRNVKDLEELEEYIVSFLSSILLMILRENPKWLAFLLEPEVDWTPGRASADSDDAE